MQRFTILLFFSFFLSSCAPFKPHHEKAAICNQLNSQMIFAGNTSNERAANIQQAEMPLVERAYHAHGCDQ